MSLPTYKRWKRAARAWVIRGFATLLMQLPLSVAFGAGAALARLAWWLSPKLRREMRASLAVAFPERTAAERDAIARASLANLGRTGGEVIAMRRHEARIRASVEVPEASREAVRRARARGKGIVIVMGHLGNWELVRVLSGDIQPNGAIAKRTWHARLDELMVRFRRDGGVETLFREDASTGRGMLRVLRQGGGLAILIDQDTDVQRVFVPFFGRLAATPRAAADLALRFGATVLVLACHRKGPRAGDGHRLTVEEVPYDAAPADREAEVVRLTAACVALQEAAIRAHPDEWVWMHQRWRTRPDGGA